MLPKSKVPEPIGIPADVAGPRSVLARTATGMGWIVGWRMATRLLGLCNTLILVRLLAPADFGLVALGSSFAMAVDTLSTLGVEDALVRERAPTPAMYDTAFTMNALRSLATAAVVAGVAVPIGAFFAEPRLANVLFALALGAVIQGVSSIGVVDFRREMAFQKEFQLQVLPRFIGILVTIAAALTLRNYWGLLAGILAGQVSRMAFSYRMHPYRPQPTLRAWRDLLGFSVWTWVVSMISLARDRADAFVIGRLLNTTAVGIYAIGEEVAGLPTNELVAPLCRACFSGFTAARHAGESMSATYLRAVSTTFLLTLPAGVGISLVADPLVRLAVGKTWLQAIPVIQIMGLIGSLTVFGFVAATLLSVHAMLRRQAAIAAGCLLVRLLLLLPLVARYGIVGAALGWMVGLALEQGVLVIFAFRHFALSYRSLWNQIWRVVLSAFVMAGIVYATGLGWHEVDAAGLALALRLVAASALGAGIYAAMLMTLWQACGRPVGAEADLLRIVRATARQVAARVRRRRFVCPP